MKLEKIEEVVTGNVTFADIAKDFPHLKNAVKAKNAAEKDQKTMEPFFVKNLLESVIS